MLRVPSLILIGLLASAPAAAREPTGHTVAVRPDAEASNPSGTRLLAARDAVFMGDRLQTGPKGEAQLQFIDGTKLVVSANASLLIDSFVVEEKSVRSFAINALKGAFRFFSGNSARTVYSITTPTVTLGIRGTQFDFTVRPDGRTEFLLLHGEVEICDRLGNCVVVGEPCTLVSAPSGEPVQAVPTGQRTQRLREFPYVLYQEARLRDDFQTNVSPCGVGEQRPGEMGQAQRSDGPSFSPPVPFSGPASDLPLLNVLFTPDTAAFGANPLSLSVAGLQPRARTQASPVDGPSLLLSPSLPEPTPTAAVPGPIAGSGLPALAALIGLVWLRRSRAAAATLFEATTRSRHCTLVCRE